MPDPKEPADPNANPSDEEQAEEKAREQRVQESWKDRTDSICPQYEGSQSLSGRCNHADERGTCFDQIESGHGDEGAESPPPPPPDDLDKHIKIQYRLQDWDLWDVHKRGEWNHNVLHVYGGPRSDEGPDNQENLPWGEGPGVWFQLQAPSGTPSTRMTNAEEGQGLC